MTSTANPRDVPVEAMRELARDRVEQSSLRHLAPEIGLGHSTLHNFLNGAAPHPRVRRLLGLWYLRETGAADGEASLRPYASALEVLLGGVPGGVRGRATAELLEVLERGYGSARPGWLQTLRDRHSAE